MIPERKYDKNKELLKTVMQKLENKPLVRKYLKTKQLLVTRDAAISICNISVYMLSQLEANVKRK
jgi:hypothetical protein